MSNTDYRVIDVETTSLDPLTCEIRGVGTYFENPPGWGSPLGSQFWDFGQFTKVFSVNDPRTYVGHNLKYDLQVLKRHGWAPKPIDKIADTMLALWLLEPHRASQHRLGLKEAVLDLFGHKMVTFEETTWGGGTKDPIEYAKEDVTWTWKLWQFLEPKLKARGLWDFFENVLMPLVPVIMGMEGRGVRVDPERLAVLEADLNYRADMGKAFIKGVAGLETSVSSPKQVRALLFGELGLQPTIVKKGKSGDQSVDYEVLKSIPGENQVVKEILKYREDSKLLSTYVEPILTRRSSSDRIHTQFFQVGTDVGRWSSGGGINLQNQPREGGIRECYIASEGHKLIVADYSQLELRMAAHLSGDEALIKAYKNGDDIHQLTAEACGCPRQAAKTLNFAGLYGAGITRLQRTLKNEAGIEVSLETTKEWRSKFFERYQGLDNYQVQMRRHLVSNPLVRTILGRVRDTRKLKGKFANDPNAAFRVGVHFEISGSSADLMMLAMKHIADREFTTLALHPLIQVHDEIVCEAPTNVVELGCGMLKVMMENVLRLRVPLVASVGSGNNWGEAKS